MTEGSGTKPEAFPVISHAGVEKTARGAVARRQVAALPFRRTPSGIEILLITSRESGRFIIPKGWPMKRLSDPGAAAREAYEEAGVAGKIRRRPIGDYLYRKRLDGRFDLVRVTVYALEVQVQHADWPEKGARQLRWTPRKEAASLVEEPGLMRLLREFRP
jgi:8-oxo-dGTP pyrophosphatase MutT (NUDIX family)